MLSPLAHLILCRAAFALGSSSLPAHAALRKARRYAAEDSIEERMIELQEQERALMKAAFERKRGEDVRQMRINDVRLLMQL